jgi:2-polyprenyl-6-methoxyphenol hydroxylase-like FAD-dependent oxidoreductase
VTIGRKRKAIIVGGGIGGLAAALALRRVGVEALVFERAPELREIGAGVGLWSNAIAALHRLDRDERVVALGSPFHGVRTFSPDGTLIAEQHLGALERKVGFPSLCIHRADLQRALVEALEPGMLQTGRTCVGFRQDDAGVTARFEGGGEERADFLVGADGVHSIVREQLLGKIAPRYAGYVGWRGIAVFRDQMLADGTSVFVLGRGSQMGIFYCGRDRVYWFITKNAPPGCSDGPRGRKQSLLDGFDTWHPLLRAAVEATEESAVVKNDIIDRPPVRTWGSGRVTLLGDAAHPTTPNLGQGACQAIEDAVILADRLRHEPEIVPALRAYERRRQRRTAQVTQQSWRLGRVFQWESPLAIRLRNLGMHSSIGRLLSDRTMRAMLDSPLPELGQER